MKVHEARSSLGQTVSEMLDSVFGKSKKKKATITVRFCAAADYQNYRNPMRSLRRMMAWPSGRQWVKLRKHWNRESPNGDGAVRFANLVTHYASKNQQEAAR